MQTHRSQSAHCNSPMLIFVPTTDSLTHNKALWQKRKTKETLHIGSRLQRTNLQATLLKAMESTGNETECVSKHKRQCTYVIGTAEIRTRIIADLSEKGYIEYSGETIIPTAKGLSLYGKVKGLVIADMHIAAEHEKLLEKGH